MTKQMQRVILLAVILLCLAFLVAGQTSNRKSRQRPARKKAAVVKPAARETQRVKTKRKQRARSSVISCRVFKRGTCKQTRKNTISSNPSVKSKTKCQQLCFATQGCAAFTFHEGGRTERRRCVLFRDCSGERGRCSNCISGPIMPRISECLAARQQLLPSDEQDGVETGQTCPAGCTAVCVGPRCQELFVGTDELLIDDELAGDTQSEDNDDNDYTNSDPLSDTDLYEVEYADEDDLTDATETPVTYTDYDYGSNDNNIESEDYEYEYSSDDDVKVEVPIDLPLEKDAITVEEEEEDVDINIDEGFLIDKNEDPVELLDLNNSSSSSVVGGCTHCTDTPLLLFFILIGGQDSNGSINIIDLLNTSLGNSALALSIAPLPLALTQGGDCSAAYTDRSITSCGGGIRSLSSYGYNYRPGSCYSYDLQSQRWEARGGKMTTFRKGGSVTKLGRYLLASGGYRQKRSLNTMELFDPSKPQRGWRRMARLKMPAAVSEHCTVAVRGVNGKEIVITGGRERQNRAMKLNLKTKRWYSLNEMNTGRQNHACVKASLNGHPGVIVSGGSARGNSSLTSVEFYDAKTGTWLHLPSMRRGRSGHVMTITRGKLMVVGGERRSRSGRQFLDDVEIFTGKRWVKSRQKLDRPRSRFSLVKIPKEKMAENKKKITRG